MPTTAYHFGIFKPGEINGFLQAQDGKVLVIMPNYTEVFTQPPVVHDDSLQVYALEIADEDLKEVQDGTTLKRYIWRGDKTSRPKPQDKITVPVLPVAAALGSSAGDTPVEAARTVFAGYPQAVQMALVIAAQDPGTMASIFPEGLLTAEQTNALLAWARQQVDAFTGPISASASA